MVGVMMEGYILLDERNLNALFDVQDVNFLLSARGQTSVEPQFQQ